MEPNGAVAVLVVDDNEDIRETLALVLSGCGYRCESAKNGVEAMQRVRRARFDAVVTDLEMPEMDGIALTRELRQSFSNLPVMIMTGHSDDDHRETAFRAGAREFLGKPFEMGNPDDGSVTLVCQKIDPTTLIDNSTFTYDICQATTLDVPWTFESTGQYDGYVPYNGTASYNGSVDYSGTAPFSGSASYSGTASFSGTASYSGTVPFTADYSGSVNYSGNSVCEYKEYASTDVIFQEGNVILDCPEQPDVPSQEVTFKTLVTRAKVGDVIRLDATGWTPGSSVSYMIMVQHAKPGKGYKNVFVKTKKPVKGQTVPGADGVFTVTSINLKDGTLVDLQDDGYVLDQPGSYRFTFKVWDASGKSAGKIVSRVVSVTE